MNAECLAHRLTTTEREFFNSTGYLIVENALDASMTRRSSCRGIHSEGANHGDRPGEKGKA